MSGLTISDLPPELLYTILSHALADILFDYLFIGALVPNDDHTPAAMDEISSLEGVSVAWRATLQRILGALVYRPNQDDVQSLPIKQQMQQMRKSHRAHHHHHQLTARAHSSSPTPIDRPINLSASSSSSSTLPDLVRTLRTMQRALRDLVQHSIDTYRSEQDALSQAHQTGVTTPTLFPIPMPMSIPQPHLGPGTPPLVPHSIPPHPSTSAPAPAPAPTQLGFSSPPAPAPPVRDHLFGALLLVAAPTLKEYATAPLFQAALCYSQAAIFTCSSSNSFSCCPPAPRGSSSPPRGSGGGGGGGGGSRHKSTACAVRVQRPDLSTLLLTTPRLVTALEWVRTREDGCTHRICPREVGEVVDGGMREVREKIEDAIRVCRWNDLLDAVFLHGERSEEMLEALDGCFDELEANAGSIQMHHLLRSNLFKTVQTIARLGPISLVGQQGMNANAPAQSCSNGEVWRSRAGALAFRWMGRVVEWTGL